MSGTLPEQLGLPIFPEKVVQYEVVLPHGPNDEYPEAAWEPVQVRVDEIDEISDPRLRTALWDQFKTREAGVKMAGVVFVKPDGSYSHSVYVPTEPLNVRFTSEGIEEIEPSTDTRETVVQPPVTKTSRMKRIISWLMN